MTESMEPLPRVGVLVLRVEVQDDHLLITVTINRNVNRSPHSARPEPPMVMSDAHAATALTAAFLRSFQHERGGPL